MEWCLYDRDLRHERVKRLTKVSTINSRELIGTPFISYVRMNG